MSRSLFAHLVPYVLVAFSLGGCSSEQTPAEDGGGDADLDSDAGWHTDADSAESSVDGGDTDQDALDASYEDSDLDSNIDSDVDPDSDVDADSHHPSSFRVLLIGNSYTAANRLNETVELLLDERGLEAIVRSVTRGGYRLDQHARDADGSNGDTELRRLLVTGDDASLGWDIVVLQQQSQVPGFPWTEPVWLDMVEGATVLRDLAEDVGADTVLMMTWGYRDGDTLNPDLFPDYPTMQLRISEGYMELANRLSTSGEAPYVAPVGMAFESLFEADPTGDFRDLYSSDGSHPSSTGSYLLASVLYATITGESPESLTSVPEGMDEVDEELVASLRATAADVVFAPDAPENWHRER